MKFGMVVAWLSLSAGALAQNDAAFDVVSIRTTGPGAEGSSAEMYPGRFRGLNRTVEWLMRIAYGVQPAQIQNLPSWARSDGFDIDARAESPALADKKKMEGAAPVLLRGLLEDRFSLKVHRESRQATVSVLVVHKNGARLKPAAGSRSEMSNNMRDGKMVLTAEAIPLANLVSLLSRQLGHPVTDKTGLEGLFDFTLGWAPEQLPDATAASIFSAIQEQLGLRIETSKGTVEVLVVDSVARPSAN